MIILRYPAASVQTEDWVDTLKDLSLAHKLELDEQLNEPQLSHSGAVYAGAEEISNYLRQLDRESEAWWYCTCDRTTEND